MTKVLFSKRHPTRNREFIVFQSNDYEDVGDYSKIYVRVSSELVNSRHLILITEEEYKYLTQQGDDDYDE